jgi:hypothetical protein
MNSARLITWYMLILHICAPNSLSFFFLPTCLCRLSILSAHCQLLAEWLLVMALFMYGMGRQESSLQLMPSHLQAFHCKLHLLSRQTCLIRMHCQVEYYQMHFVVVCIRLCIIWNRMVYLLLVWETGR